MKLSTLRRIGPAIGAFLFASAALAAAPVSDDFHTGALNTSLWSVVNPLGDGTVAVSGTTEKIATLSLPSGATHDVWTGGNQSLRIMQPITNVDFEVEVKWLTIPTTGAQLQGIIIDAGSGNYLRFDLFHDGSSHHLFAASFAANSPTVRANTTVSGITAPFWMRVKRTGSTWLQTYSTNGTSFTTVVSFSHTLTTTSIGPFAGNFAPSPPAPSFASSVDYFFNTASRISPEDGGATDSTPPMIGSISAAPSSTGATISWTTDEPATSRVDAGTTTAYGTTATDPSLVTTHSILLGGLTCNTPYNYKVTSADGSGNSASSSNRTFTTSACGSSNPPVSDDFRGPTLNTSLWTFVNPLGDGSFSLTGSTEKVVNLILPSGASHDVWTGGNQSIRLMQSISNVDFEVEVKWLTIPTIGAQLQGIIVEQGPNDFLRFDLFHDGSSHHLFAASFTGGSPSIRLNTTVSGITAPFWMRVRKTGSSWTMSTSTNGSAFTTAVSFTQSLTVARFGPFAGNFSSGTAPAFTSSVDYVFNTASPIAQEDGQAPDTTPPVITPGSVSVTSSGATIPWTTDDASTSRVDYGATTSYGTTVNDPSLVTSHSVALSGLNCNTLYHYRITSVNGAGLSSSRPDATFTTSTCPPPGSAPVSDDFRASSLNTSLWTFVNPLGDGSVSVTGTSDRTVRLSLPAGAYHDLWTDGENAIRIMQPIGNTDFEVEAKFLTTPSATSQLQGILVEQSPGNYIRFGMHWDGAVNRLFSATFSNNTPTVRESSPLCVGGGPVWLRVRKAGNVWLQSWSTLGTTFTPGVSFSYALTPTRIGLYAGNVATSGPAPAWTSIVDYFFNTSSPISPEDGVALAGPAEGAGAPDGPGFDAMPTDADAAPSAVTTTITPDGSVAAVIDGSVDGQETTVDPFAAPGPTIDVWYGDTQSFGQRGKPQTFVNILGNVFDPDGVSSLTYSLNGGAQQALSIGPNTTRLVDRGDFNAEIDYASLIPGNNSVLLRAVDGTGNVTTRTVTVNYTNGGPWPRSYTIDWATAGSIQSVAQIVDGKWAIETGGAVRTQQIGYDRLIALGDMTGWDSYDVLAEVTMHSLACADDFGVGLIVGWKGHTGPEQPRVGHPFPGLGWYAKFQSGGAFVNIYTNTTAHSESVLVQETNGRLLSLDVKYLFRFRVQRLSSTSSRYSLKIWPASSSEPANFDLTVDGELSVGSLILGAHRADVSFGKVIVTGL